MATDPLVSIIVPTRNSGTFLERCLRSIAAQTYPQIELIVVDRDSTDDTKSIARRYTSLVLNHGPERSAQRNFGVSKAKGEYVAIIDSDMELTPKVIESCVGEMTNDPHAKGVIIPEESVGLGFWARCKALERSYYVGNDDIEAARFFARRTYTDLGGYDTHLVAGEDWDLSNRVRQLGPVLRVPEFIHHNEGRIHFMDTLKKKFYYARHARSYLEKSGTTSKLTANTGPLARYKLFFSRPARLFHNPIVGVGMLFLKTGEYAAGFAGYLFPIGAVDTETFNPNSIKEWPSVSILIPTYNAEKDLERCLEAIQSLDYPADKLEVIVSDGGSTDSTIAIAKKFNVTLTDNPKRIAEFGKKIAFEKSTGEYVVLLDADNVIASKGWLKSLIRGQKLGESASDGIVTTESNYLIAPDFTSVNAYVALIVIADPLARMLASRPQIERRAGIVLRHFAKGKIPVAGANGFLWPREVISNRNPSPDELNEVGLMHALAQNQEVTIANIPGTGIYHYYCRTFRDYLAKRTKIATKHTKRAHKGSTWVKDAGGFKFALSVMYLASFIGPLCEALVRLFQTRRLEWLWHPIISLATIWLYISYTIGAKLRGKSFLSA